MFGATLKRIIKSGYQSFRRNGWLSVATITVMVLVLFVIGGIVFVGALAQTVVLSLESKIDISVYFSPDAKEENILAAKEDIEKRPEVRDVTYISRERALAVFRDTHKDNALIISALDELGENPLEASINIKAKDSSHYGAISEFVAKKNYLGVEKINYFDNQIVIDRLSSIVETVRGSGAVAALVLAAVAVLVAFNTIRLAIYSMREEIGIMRLVGASSWFIRGPFLINGLFYGMSSAAITTFLFFPLSWLTAPKLMRIVPDFDLYQYFLTHFFQFSLIMVIVGVGLGVISSFIAIRRHLEV